MDRSMLLMPFKTLIREKCGLSFEDSREAILTEGLKARVSARAVASHEEYLNLLYREPDEFNRLVNLITINETYFFREPAHITILTEMLIPDMLPTIHGRKIKIVCAGCSTGEEPYSIAIALAAKFGPGFSNMFSVVGFDIDEEALCRARTGLYAAHSFRGTPDHFRKTFFREQENGYRINETVRMGVLFLRLNLFGDSYPDTVRNADIIFYRNVSIYFEPDAQQRIFSNLANILNNKGYLFLSSSETFAYNIGLLSLVEREGVYFYGKGVEVQIAERRALRDDKHRSAAPTVQGIVGAATVKTKPAPLRNSDMPHTIFDRALACAEDKKYDEALQLTDQIIRLHASFMKAYMLRAGILLNLQRLDEAEEVCRCGMELDQWSLEGHLLLGLIVKFRGDLGEARKRFMDAVYVKSSCWLAHFYLGEIYRAEGNWQPACREFNIVIKLLEEKGSSEHELTFFSLPFPTEQIVHLCRHNLTSMKSR